jgi:hypothetical protein
MMGDYKTYSFKQENHQGYQDIDSIIRSYLADRGYNTLHRYIQFLKWGLDALKKWQVEGAQEVKTIPLQMDSKKAVRFPDDYMGYVKLGIRLNGRIVAFVRDDSIEANCNRDPHGDEVNTPEYEYKFMNCYGSDGRRSEIKGYGRNHNGIGYFTVNETQREFQFSSDVKTGTVYLEYISNGFNPNTETLVNTIAAESIRDYIHYCEARFNPRLGDAAAETRERKNTYLESVDGAKAALSNLSLEGILEATTRPFTLTI